MTTRAGTFSRPAAFRVRKNRSVATNDPRDGVTASLASILRGDRDLEALADLPRGWIAWREDDSSEWMREPHPGGN